AVGAEHPGVPRHDGPRRARDPGALPARVVAARRPVAAEEPGVRARPPFGRVRPPPPVGGRAARLVRGRDGARTRRGGSPRAVAAEAIVVAYAGPTGQTPTSLNASFSYTQAYTVYALKCVLAPGLPFNDGLLGPITMRAPEGSVVNSRFPAAGTFRHLVGHYL